MHLWTSFQETFFPIFLHFIQHKPGFIVGTPPDVPGIIMTSQNNNNTENFPVELYTEPNLVEQLRFSYDLGCGVIEVAYHHYGNSFRRRGERLLLFCRGLQIFASALHKARNSYGELDNAHNLR
jgi:hypothetical protein